MQIKPVRHGFGLLPHAYAEPLSESELVHCQGGQVPPAVWWGIITLIVSNWQDIREGFSDGVSGKPARY